MPELTKAEEIELENLEFEKLQAERSASGLNNNSQEDLPDYDWQDDLIGSATFGLADKAKSAGKAFSDYLFDKEGDGYIGDPSKFELSDLYTFPKYEKYLSKQQMARDQWRKENPKSSLASSVAGSFANPLANVVSKWQMGGKLAGSGLNPATKIGAGRAKLLGQKSQGLGQAVGRGAVGTGGMTGFQAFNEADGDFLDRLYKASEQGAIGTVMGGGIPAVVRGGSEGLKGAVNQFVRGSKQKQRTLALRKIAEALQADGLSPEQAIRRINELGPEGALLDVGDRSRELAYAVSKRNEEGAKIIDDFVDTRQFGERGLENQKIGGQVSRLKTILDDLGYGGSGRKDELALIQKEAKELYEKAYKANRTIDDPIVNSILRRLPSELKSNARKAMNLKGENVSQVNPDLTALGREQGITTGRGVGEGLKLKYLDSIKRQLWDASEEGKDQLTGRRTQIGEAYNQLRRELTEALDKADTTGFYAQARAKAGDKLSNESAYFAGQKFLSKSEFNNPNALREALGEMSPNELKHFRIGVVEKLQDMLGDVVEGGDATKKLLGKENLEDKIRFAFEGDKGLFRNFVDDIQKEQAMYRSFAKKGNSQTAEKLNAMMQANIDPAPELQGFVEIAMGNKLGGGAKVLKGIKNRITMPDLQTKELAKMLTGRGENLADDLSEQYVNMGLGSKRMKNLSKVLSRGSVPYVGQQKKKKARKGMLSP